MTKSTATLERQLDDIADYNHHVAGEVKDLKRFLPHMDGKIFADRIEYLRRAAYSKSQIGGSVNEAESLRKMENALHDYGERAIGYMSKNGQAPVDALDILKDARTNMAVVHSITDGTNLGTGEFNSTKFLRNERDRKVMLDPRNMSDLDKRVSKTRRAAELFQHTLPPTEIAKNSGTPFGTMMLNRNKLAKYLGLTDAGSKYLAMKEGDEAARYLAQGEPNALSALVGPNVSNAVRRMIPPSLLAIQEDMNR